MSNKKLLVLAAPVGTRSGYGGRSRDLATSLINSGKYDVKIIPTPWGQTPNDALDVNIPEHKAIVDRLTQQVNKKPDIFMQHTIPSEFQAIGAVNIGITAGIETTICKSDWIHGCNRMDLVLVSSEHAANVFKNTAFDVKDKTDPNAPPRILKLEKPVEVLFEGIDLDVYKKVNTLLLDENDGINLDFIREQFCFLFVGHWLQGSLGQDRKDVGMLVKTFCDTFKTKPPSKRPALILKTSGAGFSMTDRQDIINKLQSIFTQYGDGTRPNVYLIHGDLSDTQMNSLYNHPKVKTMVSFTKGEGFGRPLLEFTLSGKPVIVSNWSGQTDFLTKESSILLDGELTNVHESAANDWVMKESQWFTVDYSNAALKMYQVFNDYDVHLTKSKQYVSTVKSKFKIQDMGDMLIDYIENIESFRPKSGLPELKKLEIPQIHGARLPKLKKIQR